MKLNQLITHSTIACALLFAAASAFAERVKLLPPQSNDVAVDRISTNIAASPTFNKNRETVHFSHALDTQNNLDARPVIPRTLSKAYWKEIRGADLNNGMELAVEGDGALVRIAPMRKNARGSRSPLIDPKNIVLEKAGKQWRNGHGMERAIEADKLANTGAPYFAPGSMAFRINRELGRGPVKLRMRDEIDADERYLVHVLDRNSSVDLELTGNAMAYLRNDRLNGKVLLNNADVKHISGYLLSPSGVRHPVAFNKSESRGYSVDMDLSMTPGNDAGLWELHANVEGEHNGAPVQRIAKIAFGFAEAHARWSGDASIETNGRGDLVAGIDLEVAAASRYNLKGVLYGNNANGAMQPLMLAESATWVDEGHTVLELVFDAGILAASSLQPPYELRNLQLFDQGRMGLIQRQARALIIE